MVHGLWPQYEKGFPEYCQRPSPRLDRNIVTSMLDLMPAPGLIFNEWDRHGTCSGLGARGYFETIRKARAAVKIPEPYLELSKPMMVSPDEVEEAFVEANPGLTRTGIAVTCIAAACTRSVSACPRISASGIAPTSTGAPAAATGW